jgi:hypothetical protein
MHEYIEVETHARKMARAFHPQSWIEKFALTLCIEAFGREMRNKLFDKVDEGFVGWADSTCISVDGLRDKLMVHLEKGDMVDVANFAMMIWNRTPEDTTEKS